MSDSFQFRKQEFMPNEIMDLTENCHISYSGNPGRGIKSFASDGNSDETALVIDGEYYILNGDFRDAYRLAAEDDLVKVVDVFEENREHESTWSTGTSSMNSIRERLKNLE